MAKVKLLSPEEGKPLPSPHDMLGQLVMCGDTDDIYIVGKVPGGFVKINLRTGYHWNPPTGEQAEFWRNVTAILPIGAKVELEQE